MPRWTTTSTAAASWLCAASRPSPAASASASTRAGTSAAELAWSVPQPPSCPVLSAASRSTTSPPRTSPTTSRSGRIRSACRTNDRTVTSPAPSRLGGRASSHTQCGWSGDSSCESSTRTRRSAGSASESSAASSVVLPEPVPPLTTNAARRRTTARSRRSPAVLTAPAATSSVSVKPRARGTRREISVPGRAIGASNAWHRVPSASRTSTNGLASSRRRPPSAASRWARRRTAASSANRTSAGRSPSPVST